MKFPFSSLFSVRTPQQLALAELREAERSKLASDSAGEYADAISLYHAQRIDRLRAYLNITPPQYPED